MSNKEHSEMLDSLVNERAQKMFNHMIETKKENTEKIKELHSKVCLYSTPTCEEKFARIVKEFILMRVQELINIHKNLEGK